MRKLLLAAIAVTPLMATACAGRAPAPVQTVQMKDAMMDCTAINAEIAANTGRESELGSEKGGKVAQNVAAGVVGLFIWPVWFAMDFQGAADTESKALESRDQYLSTLALQRCSTQPMVGTSAGMPLATAR
jgi:hypothetical protein